MTSNVLNFVMASWKIKLSGYVWSNGEVRELGLEPKIGLVVEQLANRVRWWECKIDILIFSKANLPERERES